MNEKVGKQKEQAEQMIQLFSLHRGEENKSTVLKNVKKNITFTGSNAWILAGAIVIASVGLNVGSTAVIIGAMLISPLMGPIVGAGFALGTYDFELFKKSLVNLGIATAISLFFSFIYFLITPIDTANSEILSRTGPNLYDVIIAFFGGLVGVIAITHVEKGNVIQGVAIATALMPPICVAGFGLATGNWLYFLGALFLYSINCVFICVATYAIVKVLDYPKKEELDQKRAAQIQRYISIITLLMIIPSSYFAYQLYKKESFNDDANKYINDVFDNDEILRSVPNYSNQTIEIIPLNRKYSPEELKEKQERLSYYGLDSVKLVVKTDTTDIRRDILNELGQNKEAISEKDMVIQDLKNQINADNYNNQEILGEAQVLFPKVENIAVANHRFYESDTVYKIPVLVYLAKEELNDKEELQMRNWLEKKLRHDTILLYYQRH